jgi:predicted kinase
VGSDDPALELAILIGLPGAGKTSFVRARFVGAHAHVSRDLMRHRGDQRTRQLALIGEALAAGRPVVVDNVNGTVAERAALIDAGRRYGARVVGYRLDTSVANCLERNRERSESERVPAVAIRTAAKRFEPPSVGEGFERLVVVTAEAGRFRISSSSATETIFLLSPASTSGERGRLLLNPDAAFPLARALRSPQGAPLGDAFSFLSSLYFRGKLTYARAFGRPPPKLCPAFVITPGEGLRDPAEPLTIARLRRYDEVRIKPNEPRYLAPLLRDAGALAQLAGAGCRFVLLGSVASTRYVEPLLEVFGERLLFPPAFVGRGDMSRGGLLLRCVDGGEELDYAPVQGAMRHGPRPPRLPPRRRG